MAGQLLRLDLVRSWQNFFRSKGGESPRAATDILPVVFMDDAAAYPGYRTWVGYRSIAALAGNYSYCGVVNADAAGTKSVLVIDEMICRTSAAADVCFCLTLPATAPLTSLGAADDTAEEKDGPPSDRPFLGNVQIGTGQQVAATGAVNVPWGSAVGGLEAHNLTHKWTLGPQGQIIVRPSAVNIAMSVFFRGRYYSSL